jgi:ribosome-associated translation inhibitor RaiA
MKGFLRKLEEKLERMEKHFDDDVKLNTSLNKQLFEYEVNTVATYSNKK